MLAQAMEAYGVIDVVTSPGSRNAPLIIAVERSNAFRIRTVIDERSAAFIALGIAQASMKPVALVCTSGTALLNYAPAVAEAYYRKLPLIVVSADRPAAWIGQDDSQTLPQPGILDQITNFSINISGELSSHEDLWKAERLLNEAFHGALEGRQGPVHINIPLSEPLGEEREEGTDGHNFRKIGLILPEKKLSVEQARILAGRAQGKRVLIIGGFCAPSAQLNKAIATLSSLRNVVILADALANINSPGVIERPDLLNFDRLTIGEAKADILITFGGGLLSRRVKEYLRRSEFSEHWHVGANEMLIDSYFSLTQRIEISESDFFPRFANAMRYLSEHKNAATTVAYRYREIWKNAILEGEKTFRLKVKTDNWTDRKAIWTLLQKLPAQWNLQLSNGLTVRYAMNSGACRFHRRDCNRGVSGIDGSVSTAVGASLPYQGTTLLITGDMSMQYDIAALSCNYLTPRLKIAVINNGGGGIFRKIEPTRNLPELEERFVCRTNLPLEMLAQAYGLRYFRASSDRELEAVLPAFSNETSFPCLLEIITQNN